MLLLAEVEAGVGQHNFEPLDLQQVLQEVLEYYEPLFSDRQVELQLALEPGGWVLGDSHLLANAMSNLLDNFLKYGLSAEQRCLEVHLQRQGHEVQLRLRDHGAGVAPAMLERLSEHFVRDPQHQQQPGHGLGLASVKAIVRLHQGRIGWRLAQPGLETWVRLPLHQP
jgi:signal transduction histidine kinase